jgi:serine/threonine protein phosphatase PrpC
MSKIRTTAFSLAKEKNLLGDDFYDVKTVGDLTIAVVCDGVGSAHKGGEAAKRVTTYLINNFKIRPKTWSIEKSIRTFIESINAILYEESKVEYERSELVTTLALVVLEGNRLYGANVGDSRVYLFRQNQLHQLSQDHTMDEVGYESVLTQAIGIDAKVEPYYFENVIEKEDRILLCSDGLYNVLDSERLQSGIAFGAHGLVKKASKMMQHLLDDDTTALVLEIQNVDEFSKLKQQKLPILQTLEKDQVVDGYLLEKSLIQNERTWLCSKKSKHYVLKFAPLEAMQSEAISDLFVKEAWNAKRLKHFHLSKAVVPRKRGSRYYVMPYLEGENLEFYLSHKVLSIDATILLAKTVLELCQYLVRNDLVHGDIKPHNIMVVKDKEQNIGFKVIDFGTVTEIFSNSSRAGTPSFLSPERFLNEAISETTEIFSIGVMIYFALTKKYPYGEIEPFQNPSFKEAKKPSVYNKNIAPWLDSVILRAIAIEQKQRYAHYSEMLYELSNPLHVKPYFSKNTSIIERSPLLFYRTAFTVMFILNIILLIICCRA